MNATEKKLEIALGFISQLAEGLQGEDPRDVLWVIEHVPDIKPVEKTSSPNSPLRIQERFNRFPGNNADRGCAACTDLQELFVSIREPSNRQYWLMTELFVKLHGGKDICGLEGEVQRLKQELRKANHHIEMADRELNS